MSVLFGIFQRDGKPVKAEQLESMSHAFGSWQADHELIWKKGPVGIGIRQNFETPQAHSFLTPYTDPETSLIFTIECRLDNREDLAQKLQILHEEQQTIADEKLAFLAYKKWEKQCVDHLLGDWSLCVWDPQKQSLFLARDPYGMTAMSYYCDSQIVAFASNKRALLELPQIPKEPNLLRIAQTFAFWAGDMEQTAHKGIYRLPPAHWLETTTTQQTKQRYYRLEDTPMLSPSSPEEAAEKMLKLYRNAVGSVLRHPRGACISLSSGLDSASAAALAAEHLAPQKKQLSSFCSIPAYECPSHGDESPLVKELGQMWPNLAIEYIDAKESNPLNISLDVIERLAEPIGSTANYYWLDTFLNMTQERNRGTIISGEMGNLTISYNGIPRYLPTRELIRRGHHKLALYKTLSPFWLRQLKTKCTSQTYLKNALSTDFISPTLIAESDLLQSYESSNWMLNHGFAPDSKTIRLHSLAPQHDAFRALSTERANNFGIDYADPTQELRLMQFCLGLPETCYLTPTKDRALIRNAMKTLLPQSIISQHKRANQSLDFFNRLLLCDADIRQWLSQFKQKESVKAYIDLDFLSQQWDQLSQLSPNSRRFSYSPLHFLRGMTCAFFIYRYF